MAASRSDLRALEQGLDVLELARADHPSTLSRAAGWVVPKLAAVAVVLVLWQLVVALHLNPNPNYDLPSPLDVLGDGSVGKAWREGIFGRAALNTLRHAALGYSASVLAGTLLGVAMSRLRLLRVSLASLIAALQSMPSVIWVPFGLLLFGLNDTTIYFIVILGAVPSIAGGTMAALDQVPPLLVKVGRSMGARGLALYRHVIFSAALPGYVAGLRQGWSFSWRSLMAAEIISTAFGPGLGQLVKNGSDESNMPLVIAAMITILVVGLAIEELVFNPLEVGIRRRRGLAA